MSRKITTVIFDLDGTLLDTLQDLADSTNYALQKNGYPVRTLNEIRAFVGNGVRKLIERALPKSVSEMEFEKTFVCFKNHYVMNCRNKTCLYSDIDTLLHELKHRGYKLAIVSNKLQSGVTELYERFFASVVDIAIGERPDMACKPKPDMVNLALYKLGSVACEAVYIGDSEVDLFTARNADLPVISVLWGFRDRTFLEKNGAVLFVNSPMEIISLLESDKLYTLPLLD